MSRRPPRLQTSSLYLPSSLYAVGPQPSPPQGATSSRSSSSPASSQPSPPQAAAANAARTTYFSRPVTLDEAYWTLAPSAVADVRATLCADGGDGDDDAAVICYLRAMWPDECATAEALSPDMGARCLTLRPSSRGGRPQLMLEVQQQEQPGCGGGDGLDGLSAASSPSLSPRAATPPVAASDAWQLAAAQAEAMLSEALDAGVEFDAAWESYERTLACAGNSRSGGGSGGFVGGDEDSAGGRSWSSGGSDEDDAALFAALLAACERDDALARELATLYDAELARELEREDEQGSGSSSGGAQLGSPTWHQVPPACVSSRRWGGGGVAGAGTAPSTRSTEAAALAKLLSAKLCVARGSGGGGGGGGGFAAGVPAAPYSSAAAAAQLPPLYVSAATLQLAGRLRCVCGAHEAGSGYHTRDCHQAAYNTARERTEGVRAAQAQLRERMRREYGSKRLGGAGRGGMLAHLSDEMRALGARLRAAEREASVALLLSRNPALAAAATATASAAAAAAATDTAAPASGDSTPRGAMASARSAGAIPSSSSSTSTGWAAGGRLLQREGAGGSAASATASAARTRSTAHSASAAAMEAVHAPAMAAPPSARAHSLPPPRAASGWQQSRGAAAPASCAEVDLHGQHGAEAVALLASVLPMFAADGVGAVRVITGVGAAGDAPMRRQVHAWLHRRGACPVVRSVDDEGEAGVLLVRLASCY